MYLHLWFVGGELDVEIVEQWPCERIVWLAIVGDLHRGSIVFESVDGGGRG